jgi:hypothetical protein
LDNSLREKITAEIQNIDLLFSESKSLFDLCLLKKPDFIEASAAALTLHSFYNGIENILLLIAKNIDRMVPQDPQWHKTLLVSAFSATENRPAVFPKDIQPELEDFLNFRHLVRHMYGYAIDSDRMKSLLKSVYELWLIIKEDLALFLE